MIIKELYLLFNHICNISNYKDITLFLNKIKYYFYYIPFEIFFYHFIFYYYMYNIYCYHLLTRDYYDY